VRLLPRDPTSSVLLDTDNSSKMHQTSSRLLRMTEDDRPFTKVLGPPRNVLFIANMLNFYRTSTICSRR
jgi:hypothetical protein